MLGLGTRSKRLASSQNASKKGRQMADKKVTKKAAGAIDCKKAAKVVMVVTHTDGSTLEFVLLPTGKSPSCDKWGMTNQATKHFATAYTPRP